MKSAIGIGFVTVATLACPSTVFVPSPKNLEATQGASVDFAHLRWDGPAGTIDGYEIEGRAPGAEWERIGDGFVPATATAVDVSLNPSTPELIRLSFRIRAARGSARSSFSNEASYVRGIRGPSRINVVLDRKDNFTRTGPITVTWTNDSAVATEVRLERSAMDFRGGRGPWTALSLEPGAASYVDEDLQDQTAYVYRVSVGTAGIWSRPIEAFSEPTDIVPPARLVVAAVNGGFRLTWTNRSQTANAVRVIRVAPYPVEAAQVASLGPAENSYTDPLAQAWPSTLYQVEAVRDAYPPAMASSDLVAVPPSTITSSFLSLKGSDLAVPDALSATRDDTGQWHFARSPPDSVLRPVPGGWDARALFDLWHFSTPAVAVDGQRHTHTAYYRLGPPLTIWHTWHDGIAWHTEKVAIRGELTTTATFYLGVAQDGVAHVAWDDVLGFKHTVKTSGQWSEPELVTATGGITQFAVTRDGTAYAANSTALARRLAGGSWSAADPVPGISALPRDAILAAADSEHVAFVYGIQNILSDTDIWFVRKSAGAWGAPELVVNFPFTGYTPSWHASLAPDGERAHVTLILPDGAGHNPLTLITRTSAGWQSLPLGPSPDLNDWMGYGPDGKLWLLVTFPSLTGGPVHDALFLEL